MPDDEAAKLAARDYFDRFARAAEADLSRPRPGPLWCITCLREDMPVLGALPSAPGRGWAVTVLDGQALCSDHVRAVLGGNATSTDG